MQVGDLVRAPIPNSWRDYPLEDGYYGWEGKVGVLLRLENAYGRKDSRALVLINETGQVCTFMKDTLTMVQGMV